MPVITIEAGKISTDQKHALIQGLTQVGSDTLQIPSEAFVVLIKENHSDNIGTGGKMLSQVLAERSQ